MGATTGSMREACTKGLEAAAMQSGTAQHLNALETYMVREANRRFSDPTLRDGLAAAYVLAVKHEIVFQTCIIPFVDTTEVRGTMQSASVSFMWRF